VPHDKLVLTGDYFDSYGSTAQETRDTAIWLKEKILHNPKVVPLMGNHDTSYIFNENRNFRCSGYREEYNQIINSILNDDDKSKFGVYHIDQGYVFSHAGLTNELWKEYSAKFTEQGENETKLEFFDRVLKVISKEAIEAAKSNNDTVLFAAGWDRGGIYRHGGINWVDWRNLSPIKGINQIVGHSIHRIPQVLVQKVGGGYAKRDVTEHYDLQNKIGVLDKSFDPSYLSVSYDIDTHLNHYAVIQNGIVDIYHLETGINLKEINEYNIPDSEMNGLT
jgi:hypothetical protein